MYEFEKAFYDERGKGARFRLTTVGRSFYESNLRNRIDHNDLDHILEVVEMTLKELGIISEIKFGTEDRLLRINIQGCLHRPVEEKMIEKGAEPFACIPANLIVLAIEEKLNKPVEIAEIKLLDAGCQILLVIFDQQPVIKE
jgi:hypothetical protein